MSDGGIHEYILDEEDRLYNFNRNVNQGFNITQFYAGTFHPEDDIIIGGTQDNGTLLNNLSDQSFERIRGGDGAHCAINQDNPNIVYQSFQNGSVWRTWNINQIPVDWDYIMDDFNEDPSDGNAIDEGVYFINPYEMNPLNNRELVFFTRQRPWMTIEDGRSWFPLTDSIPGAFCIAFGERSTGERTAFVGGIPRNDGTPFYRIDNLDLQGPGEEVNLSNSMPGILQNGVLREIVMHPVYDSVLFVAFSSFSSLSRVWKVSNIYSDNPDWEQISGDMPRELPVNDIKVHTGDPDVMAIGTDYGVFTTSNGGVNWTLVEGIPQVAIHDLRYRESDHKLFVFTHGRGAFMGDLIPGSVTSTDDDYVIGDINIFPNPTQDILNFNTPEGQILTQLEIFGVNGSRVFAQKVNNSIDNINISMLAPGNYILLQSFAH
ncbi:MAG: T9SS type A sorting domain-containing protein, partial [Bacteroidota bacterium]